MLDYLGANQGFAGDAEKVFELAAQRNDIKLVSSSAITDILYVLRRAVKANNVDCIVTRNKSDFEENKIPSYTPVEFVKKFSC